MTAMALLALLVAGPALAGATAGTIVITADEVDTKSPDFEQTLKKQATETLARKGNDQWTLYFVAYLKRPPGASEVQLVFYDAASKKHEPVNAFPISTQAAAKIISSSVAFGVDQGFQPGHKYNVWITRLVGGREDVYARSVVTLK